MAQWRLPVMADLMYALSQGCHCDSVFLLRSVLLVVKLEPRRTS